MLGRVGCVCNLRAKGQAAQCVGAFSFTMTLIIIAQIHTHFIYCMLAVWQCGKNL